MVQLTYSAHAKYRMDERNISKATVNAVVNSGEIIEIEESGVKRIRLLDFIVVVDDSKVVTVFSDSDMKCQSCWSPKKKQREGNKVHRATYIEGRGRVNISLSNAYLKEMRKNN